MMKIDGNIKTILTVALVLAVIILAIVLFSKNPSEDLVTNKAVFLESLAKAQQVYIIMDLRNVENATIRDNIMQCGTDFAGSAGLVEKSIATFALEDDNCISINGTTSAKNCIDQSKNGASILIQGTMNTTYYQNKVVVKISQQYTKGTCGIQRVE